MEQPNDTCIYPQLSVYILHTHFLTNLNGYLKVKLKNTINCTCTVHRYMGTDLEHWSNVFNVGSAGVLGLLVTDVFH